MEGLPQDDPGNNNKYYHEIKMSRADSHIHGGSREAYARSAGIEERVLCVIYLSAPLSAHLPLNRESEEEMNI